MASGADSGRDIEKLHIPGGMPESLLIPAPRRRRQSEFVIGRACKADGRGQPFSCQGVVLMRAKRSPLHRHQQEHSMKKTVSWVLTADGAQARILENTG